MRIVEPSATMLFPTCEADAVEQMKLIERAGRVAYRSEDRITEDSYIRFIDMIISKGHESVLEHAHASILFVTDRGVSHELVRHRIASFTQESTRYCNYAGKDMEFVAPVDLKDADRPRWEMDMQLAERAYNCMLADGYSPQVARSVLPNALATRIVVTANLREWRHILQLRLNKAAHPDMQRLMLLADTKLKRMFRPCFQYVAR